MHRRRTCRQPRACGAVATFTTRFVTSGAFLLRGCRASPSASNTNLHRAYRMYHSLSRGAAGASQWPQYAGVLNAARCSPGRRQIGLLALRVVRGLLKVRYFVLTGTVAGGYTIKKSYDDFVAGIPGTEWLADLWPSDEQWRSVQHGVSDTVDKLRHSISSVQLDPAMHRLYGDRVSDLREWLAQRLDDAIETASTTTPISGWVPLRKIPLLGEDTADADTGWLNSQNDGVSHSIFGNTPTSSSDANSDADTDKGSLQQRLEVLQQEMMSMQTKYQQKLDQIELDNKELRKRLLLLSSKTHTTKKKAKRSLIDMYSEVLDELTHYDSTYDSQDHLPRVVVVGDQSAGKTSVLEMIARARIFPRGAGEMMTRAPVKVTLSESADHVAQFSDSERLFDLTNEQQLKELRREIEVRMRRSCGRDGMSSSVSSEVISLTVRGPGLQRMVLVDLPGVISTETVDMATDTRATIRRMCQQFMANPNAIILCVQDGSVDAERSNVTDLVSKVDPSGRRTVFVLTKVDLAEKNLANPDRIRRILSGKLFPMQALGYFAVVTGRGNSDDSIEQITNYEQEFFQTSKLFRSGVISSSQCTARNLSLCVSERFWRMVRETADQQAETFRATRFNLETEWKNNFPRLRELDRDELFERARGEILDQVVNLATLSAQHWQQLLVERLWASMTNHVFETIYLPAAQSNNAGTFNTSVDIKLRQWADDTLSRRCVDVGWHSLEQEFRHLMARSCGEGKGGDTDAIFSPLKLAVLEAVVSDHRWQQDGGRLLRVVQLNTLEDRAVPDQLQWHTAVDFLQQALNDKLKCTEELLHEMCGPGAWQRWAQWSYASQHQQLMTAVKTQLEQLLHTDPNHGADLPYEELSVVRKSLQQLKLTSLSTSSSTSTGGVDADVVREVWRPVYRRHFLRRSLARAADCRRAFWQYRQQQQQGSVDLSQSSSSPQDCECDDVVLFWRIRQMLHTTANTLRQQIVNTEARRLEQRVKEVLEEWSVDVDKKRALLTGRRVTLAEELKQVRRIQEKLEHFVSCLQNEK